MRDVLSVGVRVIPVTQPLLRVRFFNSSRFDYLKEKLGNKFHEWARLNPLNAFEDTMYALGSYTVVDSEDKGIQTVYFFDEHTQRQIVVEVRPSNNPFMPHRCYVDDPYTFN